MQHAQTVARRMISSARRLPVGARRRGGVGMVVAVLLPLQVGALGTGVLDTSFSGDGKVTTNPMTVRGAERTGMRSVTTSLAERGKSRGPPCPPGQRRFDVWLIGY
jgi:hypothetical protein